MSSNRFNPYVSSAIAASVLCVVDKGLVCGVGEPKPGHMCVEAAVCYAMGEDHSDEPECVDVEVREFKISLNDNVAWGSDMDRARGLRALAIAQLGSADMKMSFKDALRSVIVKRYLSKAFPMKALLKQNPKWGGFIRDLYKMVETGNFTPLSENISVSEFISCNIENSNKLVAMLESLGLADEYSDHPDEEWFVLTCGTKVQKTNEKAKLQQIAKLGVEALTVAGSPGVKFLPLLKKSKTALEKLSAKNKLLGKAHN